MYKRISMVSLFFFILSYNYIWLRTTLFPHFYNTYGVNGIFYILFIAMVIGLFFLILPKALYKIEYKEYEKSKYKNFLNAILFIRIALGIAIVGVILYTLFFYDYPLIMSIIGIVLVILIISNSKPSDIIQISTLFGIIGLLLYFFYLYQFIELDFSLISFDFKLDNYILYILLAALIFDNLIYLITDKEKLKITKKTVIIGIMISFLLLLFEYSFLTLSSGDELFKNSPLSGFQALSIEPITRFNGNFDYIYIVLIITSIVFKMSYFLSIIKNSIKSRFGRIKEMLLLLISLSALIYIFYIINENNVAISYSLSVILFLLCGSILIWFIWVVKNAKKA
ncbi:MAG: oligosaccharide repeat unit polymerase [Acholeplasmatales bacterium]|nr:oligosaccharide repeat unit polymerase [Acholeplasmatales bacterium]